MRDLAALIAIARSAQLSTRAVSAAILRLLFCKRVLG